MRVPLIAVGTALMLMVGLLATQTEAAVAPGYYGSTDAGGELAFGAKFNAKGAPTQVKHLRWSNIPATCTGFPPTAHSGDLKIAMKVDDRGAFHGSDELPTGAKVTFSGHFTHRYRKATGTFRLQGEIAGCANADTGKLGWDTTRKP